MGKIQDCGQGRNASELPEGWLKRMEGLSRAEKIVALKLLKVKKFRSPVRANLRAILVRWLEGGVDGHSKSTPFSQGEWDRLGVRFARKGSMFL